MTAAPRRPQPVAPSGLPEALVGRDDQRLRNAGNAARASDHRGDHVERHAVRVRAAGHGRVPAVHPAQPAGRSVGRSPSAAPDPDRRRPGEGGRPDLDPDRLRPGRPDDLAALHRRLHQRLRDRVLRCRLSVVSPVPRRSRPARRWQLEARDESIRGTDHRARRGGRTHRGVHGAARDPPRRAQLRCVGAVHVRDPSPRAGPGAGVERAAASGPR